MECKVSQSDGSFGSLLLTLNCTPDRQRQGDKYLLHVGLDLVEMLLGKVLDRVPHRVRLKDADPLLAKRRRDLAARYQHRRAALAVGDAGRRDRGDGGRDERHGVRADRDTGFGLTEYWRDELGCEVKIVVAMPELNGVVC